MTFRFHHEETIRWVDADAMGVLNNAVYLTLLEQARFAYFGELDLLDGHAFPFVLGETTVRFLRPGRGGDRLVVAARVDRLGNKSFSMRYEVRRGDEVLATASATLVCVDPTLRSCPIPVDLRRKVAAFEGIPERGA